MTDSASNNPVLTFEGKRYDLNTLPDELKELVRGMQVADAQLRMHEDTLKVLAVGRQSLASQLNERLKSVTPMPRRPTGLTILLSTRRSSRCGKSSSPWRRRCITRARSPRIPRCATASRNSPMVATATCPCALPKHPTRSRPTLRSRAHRPTT